VSGKAHTLEWMVLRRARCSCTKSTLGSLFHPEHHMELAGVLRRRAKTILTRTADRAAIASPKRRAGRSGALYDGPPE
jgi:hypothetical protein